MKEITDIDATEKAELQRWIKKSLNAGVYELIDLGIAHGDLVEAKPAWVLPFTLLIGKMRERGNDQEFRWFICGDGPTSHADAAVAASPREVARYFSLSWQLQAQQMMDKGEGEADRDRAEKLATQAAALYELVESPEFWGAA